MIERALLINGTVGVGKTTIAEAVSRELALAGNPHAWIDLDALSGFWPPPWDDPFNVRVSAQCLMELSSVYAAAGARSLVLAGVVDSSEILELYRRSVGVEIVIIRLRLALDEVESRLRSRHGEYDESSLEWHIARAPILEELLDNSGVAMHEVRNSGDPSHVAREVLTAAGWTSS